ncbi:MAG: GNAT family N-acetyltransferase [Chloroflexota bacterium]|nr:GNAT family N-acetyltransferase [Chloroflexota bacterium]
MLVRQIQAGDIAQVRELHSLLHGKSLNQQEILDSIKAVQRAKGAYLVAVEAGQVVGYLSYALIPGLSGWYNLNLYVHPHHRRKGCGQALLESTVKIVRQLPEAQILLAMFEIENEELAHFLKKAGLSLEKYDWHYELNSLEKLPTPLFPPTITLESGQKDETERFVKLHYRSFEDTAYFQPYKLEEVNHEQQLSPYFQMIFACDQQGQDVGVIWWRLEHNTPQKSVIIEPLGIIPAWRRKGLGRALMLEALGRAQLQGAQCSELWFQSWNHPARQLYEQLGYRKIGGKVTYVLHFKP